MKDKSNGTIVAIIAGSKSDEKIVKAAVDVLDEYDISYEVKYLSAHRNPEELRDFIDQSQKTVDIYICIAGLAALLPSFVVAHTKKPVIGVPVNIRLGGLDALLSIVQTPSGVPIACVGIDNGKNAAHLALRILALKDQSVRQKLDR
ncbi:MAG: 5-(carboxyamino)imidazole ribonucleotide mutase [Candidatus Hodarchaeota archaeon]